MESDLHRSFTSPMSQPEQQPLRLLSGRSQELGDMLRRLSIIAPSDLHAITRLVRDTLKRAEAEHALNRRRGTRY